MIRFESGSDPPSELKSLFPSRVSFFCITAAVSIGRRPTPFLLDLLLPGFSSGFGSFPAAAANPTEPPIHPKHPESARWFVALFAVALLFASSSPSFLPGGQQLLTSTPQL